VDKVRLKLEKFVLEESKKIAKEKSENSDDMRMLLRPRRLRQVLLNIANNATKFTEQGRIIISAQPQRIDERDWIIIGMTDTGIGMTEEQIGRLFQQFFQADTSFTRKYGGAGLGLAISRHFCLMMGGNISVVSETSKGSTFTIRLPRIVDAPAVASAHTGEAALKPH
jgi:signal transduction histidine kinase